MNKSRHWIALSESSGIGYASMNEIYTTLSQIGISISDLFELSEKEIISEFTFNSRIVNGIIEAQKIFDEIEEDYLNMIEANIHPLLFFEKEYPDKLKKELKSNTPSILYCFGNLNLLNKNSAAILGHSEISTKGENIILQSAKILCSHDIVVTSGLSKGAGSIAHYSAIENKGNTIAFLPCGMFTFNMSEKLKSIFDPDHFLLVSQFPLNSPYSEFNAMSRNRLICAISDAVFIAESTEEGGIFEAAKSASKLQKPIFVSEYSEYPESAKGNPTIIKIFSAHPVRGRKEDNIVIPNLDSLLSKIKF